MCSLSEKPSRDIFDDTEILGGAALNFSANIQRLGGAATLISGVGADDRGHRAINAMKHLGLKTEAIQIVAGEATGIAFVQSEPGGETTFHIPRPAAFDRIDTHISAKALGSIDWIYFGTLLQTEPVLEAFIAEHFTLSQAHVASTISTSEPVTGTTSWCRD